MPLSLRSLKNQDSKNLEFHNPRLLRLIKFLKSKKESYLADLQDNNLPFYSADKAGQKSLSRAHFIVTYRTSSNRCSSMIVYRVESQLEAVSLHDAK